MSSDGHRTRSTGPEAGFSLVEILVTMLILGLLAAIAVPTYLSQRNKATDAEAKVSAWTASSAIEVWATERDGAYSGASVAEIEAIEPTLVGAAVAIDAAAADSYAVSVGSPTGNRFTVERLADGSNRLTCTVAGTSGCPRTGDWGR